MVDLTLTESDAGGAVLTLPRVTGVTDTLEGVDNTQGLATAQLAVSLAASFTAHDAIEVKPNADSTVPTISEVHGERVLLLNCGQMELGGAQRKALL